MRVPDMRLHRQLGLAFVCQLLRAPNAAGSLQEGVVDDRPQIGGWNGGE